MNMKSEKDKLAELANLMNEQSETPIFISDELLEVMDAALGPEEVDFLLKMGGGSMTLADLRNKVGIAEEEFEKIFKDLLDKGPITEMEPQPNQGEALYHLMSIFPGWFEFYLMRGAETPDRKLFAERIGKYYQTAQAFEPEFINTIIREMGPHRSIAVVNPPGPGRIAVGQAVEPSLSEVYPPHSILRILEDLDEDETVALGHCFCRQQRKMEGDPCRMELPERSCMTLGPAAEHLIRRGIAQRIAKEEALRFIKDVAAIGAVHQVGKLVPLKDFNAKYEVDIICNCCWDCCGAFGNYSRGNTPFMLKSFYRAEIPDDANCTGCGTCEEVCPVRAISVSEEGVTKIHPDMCCGCGLCAFHCPVEAVRLVPSEREVFLPLLDKSKQRIPD
jgi:ferredoxin